MALIQGVLPLFDGAHRDHCSLGLTCFALQANIPKIGLQKDREEAASSSSSRCSNMVYSMDLFAAIFLPIMN
jgi:hypothetical protein